MNFSALETIFSREIVLYAQKLPDKSALYVQKIPGWFPIDPVSLDAIVGNHDLRVAKATQGQITIDMLIEDTGVQLGQYSYLYLWNPATKEWTYVCHQFNYSKTSVKREHFWRPRIEV